MEDNNKKAENAAHWDDHAGTWPDKWRGKLREQVNAPDELSKEIADSLGIEVPKTMAEWLRASNQLDIEAMTVKDREKLRDKQVEMLKDIREHPEHWSEGTSVQVETTEEQREKLRELRDKITLEKAQYGSKPIRNEETGTKKDPMEVLKAIKLEKREVLFPESVGRMNNMLENMVDKKSIKRNEQFQEKLKEAQQMKADKVLEIMRTLPEELQVEIATKVLDRANTKRQEEVESRPADRVEYPQVQAANYMQVIPDSQGYSALEQIKESLRILQIGYEVKPVPEEGIHINWPPISIEYMIKGIENTIAAGYQLKQQDNGSEE